ncbi:hypothetical protein DV736_g1474, partial [Chaetothyriales sp. CBS 134916]
MSPIASNIVTILALSSTALAFPKAHRHHHWNAWGPGYGTGHGTGSGSGFSYPTGRIPLPAGSEGKGAGSSAQATSNPALTVTVLPVAASSASLSSNAGDNNVASASTSPCTSTSTSTTLQYVTVTASLGWGGSNVAALSVSDSVSVVPTSTGSVQAGEFFGRPSQPFSYGGGFGGWGHYSASSSADVSTPVASEPVESSSAESTQVASEPVESSAESTPVASVSAESSSSVTSWAAGSTTVASETVGSSASSAASSAWPSSTSSSSSGSSSGKKGLSYNAASLLSAFDGSSASWAYNWAASPGGTIPSDLEFVPMLWGLKSVSGWSEAAASAISSGSKHILSFNEPDLGSQSSMDPATAAQNHIQYLNPLAGQVQIGSPAITNGAGTSPLMGLDWLSSFYDSCNGECQIDFIAFHWYGSSSNLADLKSHVNNVVTFAQSKGVSNVWLTEFGTTDGSESDVATFVTEATSFLDSTSAVQRYAFFMAAEGSGQLLSSGGALNSIGEAYVSS